MIDDECPEAEFGHVWVAGMCYVHAEDADSTARARAKFGETVECERCDHVYQVGKS